MARTTTGARKIGSVVKALAVFAVWGGVGLSPFDAAAEEVAAATAAAEQPKPKVGVGQVTVTATRREENVQDVSIPISAFEGKNLESRQINNLENLSGMVPGLVINLNGGSQVNPGMRGSFVAEDSPGAEMPLAVFVDNIYSGSAVSMFADLYDVGSVEVLRGPQGTTFGRNATSGVIRILNNKPDFDGTSGRISATLVNYPGFKAEGFLNHAFNDKVAGRISFINTRYDGFRLNTVTGNKLEEVDRWSVRAQLAFRPTENLDILLSGSYAQDRSKGTPRKGVCALRTTFEPYSCQVNLFPTGFAPTLDVVEIDDDGFTDRNIWSAFMEVNWDFGFATFTSVTAGRGLDLEAQVDIEGSPWPQFPRVNGDVKDEDRETQFSQEIRLVSPSGQDLEWIVGMYFLRQSLFRQENNHFRPQPGIFLAAIQGPYDTITLQDLNVTSLAPYAEAKYHITNWIAAFAGVRYTWDKKAGITQHLGDSNVFTGAAYLANLDKSWDAVTPRFGVEVTPTDDILLFATVSKGFKSGGFSNNANTKTQAEAGFEPEHLWNYEVGFKTAWLEDRVHFNVNAFWADISDLQVRVFNPILGFVFGNAGTARSRGVELEFTAVPIEGLQFEASYGYLDAKYVDFAGCISGQPASNCAGNDMMTAPKHSLFMAAQYSFPVASLSGQLTLRGEFEYKSKRWSLPTNTDFQAHTLSDYTMTNLYLNYESDDGNWELSIWGRNIFDNDYAGGMSDFTSFFVTAAELPFKSVHNVTPAGNRSYGLTVSRRF